MPLFNEIYELYINYTNSSGDVKIKASGNFINNLSHIAFYSEQLAILNSAKKIAAYHASTSSDPLLTTFSIRRYVERLPIPAKSPDQTEIANEITPLRPEEAYLKLSWYGPVDDEESEDETSGFMGQSERESSLSFNLELLSTKKLYQFNKLYYEYKEKQHQLKIRSSRQVLASFKHYAGFYTPVTAEQNHYFYQTIEKIDSIIEANPIIRPDLPIRKKTESEKINWHQLIENSTAEKNIFTKFAELQNTETETIRKTPEPEVKKTEEINLPVSGIAKLKTDYPKISPPTPVNKPLEPVLIKAFEKKPAKKPDKVNDFFKEELMEELIAAIEKEQSEKQTTSTAVFTDQKTQKVKKGIRERVKHNYRASIAVLAIFVIFFSTTIYLYLNRPGTVTGRIVDSRDSSSMLTGVNVSIDGREPVENNSLTGLFLLYDVKPGKHLITFNRDNYAPQTQEITLVAGQELNITVPLTLVSVTEVSNTTTHLAVTNSSDANLSVVDPDSKTILQTVSTGNKPNDIIALIEKGKIYSSNSADSTISVIDAASKLEIKKIQLESGAQPTKLALSPPKDKLYVLSLGLKKIITIDTANDIELPSNVNTEVFSFDFAVDQNSGNFLILDNLGINTVNSGGTVVNTFKFAREDYYERIYHNTVNNIAYVIHSTGSYMLVADLANNKESIVNFEEKPNAVLTSPGGGRFIYVLFYNTLSILNIDNFEVYKGKIPTGGTRAMSMTFSPDATKLFIVNHDSNDISVFDVAKEEMLPERITVGKNPRRIISW